MARKNEVDDEDRQRVEAVEALLEMEDEEIQFELQDDDAEGKMRIGDVRGHGDGAFRITPRPQYGQR